MFLAIASISFYLR